MFSWFIALLGLGLSWHFTDLSSEASLQNTICPVLVGIFLIITLVKLIANPSGSSSGSGGGGFFGDFGGGDGGCGGGGD